MSLGANNSRAGACPYSQLPCRWVDVTLRDFPAGSYLVRCVWLHSESGAERVSTSRTIAHGGSSLATMNNVCHFNVRVGRSVHVTIGDVRSNTVRFTGDPVGGSPPPPAGVPGPAQDVRIRVEESSSGRILVARWSPPADDGGSRIASYTVTISRPGRTFGPYERSATSRRVHIRNPRYNTTYTVRVTVKNVHGSSDVRSASVAIPARSSVSSALPAPPSSALPAPPTKIDDPFDLYKGPSDDPLGRGFSTQLVDPEIRKTNLHRNKSYFDTARNLITPGWNGSHQYACGVKNDPTVEATYHFGAERSDGKYELTSDGYYKVYAYYPGNAESAENKNDGTGSFGIELNGQRIRWVTQGDQYDGWKLLNLSDSGFLKLKKGDNLTITAHNGHWGSEGSNGRCAPNTTVVFPPLLLVHEARRGILNGFRPFDPVRDINPVALSVFAACMATAVKPAYLDGGVRASLTFRFVVELAIFIASASLRIGNVFPSSPIPDVPGQVSIDSALVQLAMWAKLERLRFVCGTHQMAACPTIPTTGHWREPDAIPNVYVVPEKNNELVPLRLLHPLAFGRSGERGFAGYDYFYNGEKYSFKVEYGGCDTVTVTNYLSDLRESKGESNLSNMPSGRPRLDQVAHDIYVDDGIIWIRDRWK